MHTPASSTRIRQTAAILAMVLTPLAAFIPTARAQEPAAAPGKTALGVDVSTLGFGATVHFRTSPKFTVTLGYNWAEHDRAVEDDDSTYDGTIKLSNFSAFANWHPYEGRFRLTGGAVLTNNTIPLRATPAAGNLFEIGDSTYTAAQIGSLIGSAELSKGVAPYLGLGWSKTPAAGGWGFYADLGVLFTDSPSVSLRATGSVASDPAFQAELAKEIRSINDELDSFKLYPVIRLGVMYRF